MYPNKKEFLKLAKTGNVVPVFTEIQADLETPVSAYLKIADRYSFLLESVEGGENIARYSFLGHRPALIFRSRRDLVEIIEGKKTRHLRGNPFVILKKLLKQYRAVKVPGLPRFHGGLVGYVGYDNVRFIEKIPDRPKAKDDLCDIQLMLADTLLVFDRVAHKIIVIANVFIGKSPERAYTQACQKIKALTDRLSRPVKLGALDFSGHKQKLPVASNFSRPAFVAAVNRAKKYIRDGEVIQVVLSQKFKTKTSANPFNVYRALRAINPSPYMFYLSFDKQRLIGASPEVMVRLEEGSATIRPIAGTRRRGKDATEDQKLSAELLADAKERAEHIMLVDLARNDLGRVCDYRSVRTTELMAVEKYSHVMHIVSNVVGKLKRGKDAVDLLCASFPAGTVSGAPKVRAMEIIDELEPARRGPYAGCVCYFDFSGGLDSCITIRTIVVSGQTAYVQAGAGIVADSNPQKEFVETQNKARACLTALES
ncbi:MAG: anthranilate synthase component I [Candidatus Margulisiibacteriota bacterium]